VILVDTSVWVDCFRGEDTAQAGRLDALLGETEKGAWSIFVLTSEN